MITADLRNITALSEFTQRIRDIQEEAHGEGYCDIHDGIVKCMENSSSYKELGVNQGGTAAAALMTNPERIELIDLTMKRFDEYLGPIAREYCEKNNISLTTLEMDSTSKNAVTDSFDVLLIDSYHKPDHLRKEMNLHKDYINKYMIFHDTNIISNGLKMAIISFTNNNPWKIVEDNQRSNGYMVIERTGW